MLKKILSITIACLLLSSVTPFTGVSSAAQDDSIARAERAIKEAQASAVYDATGRVMKMTLTSPTNEKVTIGLSYDTKGQLDYLIQENGLKIGVLYNESGQLQGIALPDGGRMVIKRNISGKFIGFTRELPKEKGQVLRNQHRPTVSNAVNLNAASYLDESGGDCREAVETAAAAAIVMAAACATNTLACIAATVNFAFAAARAYRACNPDAE